MSAPPHIKTSEQAQPVCALFGFTCASWQSQSFLPAFQPTPPLARHGGLVTMLQQLHDDGCRVDGEAQLPSHAQVCGRCDVDSQGCGVGYGDLCCQ